MNRLLRWSGILSPALLAFASFACSSSPGGFNVGPNGDASDGNDATASSGGGGSGGSGSSSGGAFGGSSSGSSTGTGSCQTGVYMGTFSCFFYSGVDAGIGSAPDSGGVGPITGSLSFMLTQDISSRGEIATTDTASGTFAATTGIIIAAAADLQGTLDCSAGKFTGKLVNGQYGLNNGGTPVPDPKNKFEGPLVSDYNGKTSTFANGQWSMNIASLGPCIGTWTATYSGPLDGGADASTAVDASHD